MNARRSWLSLGLVVLVVWGASQWWARSHRQQLGEHLAAAAAPGDIQMISSTTCGICTQARLWFEQNGVPFDECFVEKNAACAARFEAMRAPGTPVIVVRGQAQLGFDPQRLLRALQQR